MRDIRFPLALAMLLASLPLTTTAAQAIELGLPAQCNLGEDCFMQQYPDMDESQGVADPLCGGQSYDGHKGTDLRLRSMKDVEKGYAVIAVEEGEVLRVRDGEADRIVETEDDRAAIAGRECGNGLVIRLGDGYEVQYCHMRSGSLVVKPGDTVGKGAKLGEVGASGLAQFPHVHITVSRNGEVVDPLTGRRLADGCTPAFRQEASLFSKDIVEKLDLSRPEILASGLAGKPIDHQALVHGGPPPQVSSRDRLFVAWGWFANLKKDDRIGILLKDESGAVLIDNTSEPIDRNKATYSAFAGKKRSLAPGRYEVEIRVIRGEEVLQAAASTILVQ